MGEAVGQEQVEADRCMADEPCCAACAVVRSMKRLGITSDKMLFTILMCRLQTEDHDRLSDILVEELKWIDAVVDTARKP